jgi:hypothetical protein
MNDRKEAHVVIEGVPLTPAQSASVRCAVSSFLMELNDPEQCKRLGPIADGYRTHLRAVESMLVQASPGATCAPRRFERLGGDQPMQPMQPILDTHGVARFKANAIIKQIVDKQPDLMNCVAAWDDLPVEDHEQFHQLTGWSVSGYGDTDVVRRETIARADAIVNAGNLPTSAAHPAQPIEDGHGIKYFKANRVVRRIVGNRLVDWDAIRQMDAPFEDWQQFYQLLGRSVRAVGTLLDKDTKGMEES